MQQDDSLKGRGRETTILKVPPQARYARVVRLTAANIASIEGLSVDDVDDVRMAAEEAFVYACATGVRDTMTIEFTLTDDALEMVFELGDQNVAEDASEPSLVYSALILDAMCDECHISDESGSRMRLVKRMGNADVL